MLHCNGDNRGMNHFIAPERGRPASLADLFFSFTWLALQGFGGVLAVIER